MRRNTVPQFSVAATTMCAHLSHAHNGAQPGTVVGYFASPSADDARLDTVRSGGGTLDIRPHSETN